VEVMANNLRTFFSGAHIIADAHYELGNKLMKWFGHEKEVIFYTPIAKQRRRKKKTLKKLPVDTSFQLSNLSKEQKT
jgi:hypothetical protein